MKEVTISASMVRNASAILTAANHAASSEHERSDNPCIRGTVMPQHFSSLFTMQPRAKMNEMTISASIVM